MCAAKLRECFENRSSGRWGAYVQVVKCGGLLVLNNLQIYRCNIIIDLKQGDVLGCSALNCVTQHEVASTGPFVPWSQMRARIKGVGLSALLCSSSVSQRFWPSAAEASRRQSLPQKPEILEFNPVAVVFKFPAWQQHLRTIFYRNSSNYL